MRATKNKLGFTIVELLIVVVVIAILAAITVVAYNGIQNRAKLSKLQTDIRSAQKLIEGFYAQNGYYPRTDTTAMGSGNIARTDDNCAIGSSQADWIPEVNVSLPQSTGNEKGENGYSGCFMYVSDGQTYILSAWNMLSSAQTDVMYRRVGFRETSNSSFTQYYLCNHVNIGGGNPTPYGASRDYYKHSYTVSNITSCNETPPAGA